MRERENFAFFGGNFFEKIGAAKNFFQFKFKNGANDGDRTHDQRDHNPLLYHWATFAGAPILFFFTKISIFFHKKITKKIKKIWRKKKNF